MDSYAEGLAHALEPMIYVFHLMQLKQHREGCVEVIAILTKWDAAEFKQQ